RSHADRAERQRLSWRGRGRRAGLARQIAEALEPRARHLPAALHHQPSARHGRRSRRRPWRARGADALCAPAGAVGLRRNSRGDEPQAHARRLSPGHRASARRAARPCLHFRFHRRLPRRERRGFQRHAVAGRGSGPRHRLLLHVFAAARHAGRRDGRAGCARGEGRAAAAAAGRHQPPPARLQCLVRRPHARRAAGKARPAARTAGRPLALFAGGAGDGAGLAHRPGHARRRHRSRQQQPVRRARWRRSHPATGHRRSIEHTLRTQDPVIPPAAASEDTATTQTVLAFEDNRLASILFGQYGQNLALVERRLGVMAEQRGNHVTLEGSRGACEQARRVLEGLYEQIRRGRDLSQGDVEGAIRQAIAQGSLFDYDPASPRPAFEEINLRKRRVRARTAAQDAYIRALKRCALVFSTGPAGTGKTWIAVAQAVQLFERKEVDRIVLSRPAVEAGERLGFLPGDMREKVDPYLRPIYDALYDLMDPRIVERALQSTEIEIAPLAFMRGRTLSNAAIILDEAQNTTAMQMKMLLTRLGENSRMIVTGDPSQVDLPPGQTSGLAEAVRLLEGVEGIAHVKFSAADVIRHELVARIVEAYDKAAAGKRERPE